MQSVLEVLPYRISAFCNLTSVNFEVTIYGTWEEKNRPTNFAMSRLSSCVTVYLTVILYYCSKQGHAKIYSYSTVHIYMHAYMCTVFPNAHSCITSDDGVLGTWVLFSNFHKSS